jgi:hypothetical protein
LLKKGVEPHTELTATHHADDKRKGVGANVSGLINVVEDLKAQGEERRSIGVGQIGEEYAKDMKTQVP